MQENEITFVDLVRILVLYKFLAVAVLIVTVAVGVALAFVTTPVYQAEVVIAPADENRSAGASSLLSRLGGLGGFVGLGRLGRQDKVSQAIATLESQQFTRRFIADKELLPVLFADKWDAATKTWNVDDPEDIPGLSDAFDKFDDIRTITEEDSGLITLAIEWTDPALAAEWANDLVWRLNERLRADAIKEADETIDFLNKEVEKTRIVQLQQAIYFMLEEQINVKTMANIRQEFAFKVISPAIVPDEDKYVWPNRPLILAVAFVLGLFFAILASSLVYGLTSLRRELRN